MSLCKLINNIFQIGQSLPGFARKKTQSFFIPNTNKHHPLGKEARPYACRKGSYTLEAAVIIPVFAAFLVFFLFYFRVLQVQTQVQEALYYAGRKTASEASIVESQMLLYASAQTYFQKELRQYETVDAYVTGGNWGISLNQSDVSGSYIELQADYYLEFPIKFFGLKGITVTQRSKNRKWTGDRNSDSLEDYVYVTKRGSVYHCSRDCNYLDLSIQAVHYAHLGDMRNKSDHKYYACVSCVSEGSCPDIVYITDYGTAYHSNIVCSGLKRSVYLIPISEIAGRTPCTKCGGK